MRRQATKRVFLSGYITNYFRGLFKVPNYITFLVETTSARITNNVVRISHYRKALSITLLYV